MKICNNCGSRNPDNYNICPRCGTPLSTSNYNSFGKEPNMNAQPQWNNSYYNRNNPFDEGPEGRSRGIAALLAIFLGQLGVQYFYLGKWQGGIFTIILTAITCGAWYVVSLIQGIMMLCMSNEEFRRKFVTNPSSFPIF